MTSMRVRVPATSANLGPGFDALGLALQLYNHVTIGPAEGGADAAVTTGEGAGTLSSDADNIAVIAARTLLRELNAPASPFRLQLENSIPLSRGLGSSAAARAGALVAANQWARVQGWGSLTTSQLVSLATRLEGHPDNVAAALLGGLVASAAIGGEGTEVSAVAARVPVPRFPSLVVFIPSTELATKTARAVLPDAVFRADATFNVARASLLVAALAAERWDLLPEALQDKLHQEHRAVLMPGYHALVRAALEVGAYGATLSGAGPSVLAWLLPDEKVLREARQAMEEAAAEHEVFGEARTLEVDLGGAQII